MARAPAWATRPATATSRSPPGRPTAVRALAPPARSAQRHVAPLRSAERGGGCPGAAQLCEGALTEVRALSSCGTGAAAQRAIRSACTCVHTLQADEAQVRAARRASASPSHGQRVHCAPVRGCMPRCVLQAACAAAAPTGLRARARRELFRPWRAGRAERDARAVVRRALPAPAPARPAHAPSDAHRARPLPGQGGFAARAASCAGRAWLCVVSGEQRAESAGLTGTCVVRPAARRRAGRAPGTQRTATGLAWPGCARRGAAARVLRHRLGGVSWASP